MEKAQAKLYRQRWQVVEEIRQIEARTTTLDLYWRQLNALYAMSRVLHLRGQRDDEIAVYRRWAKLRRNASLHGKA